LSLYYFLVNTKVRAGLDDSRANAANSQGIVLGLTTNRAGANRSPLDRDRPIGPPGTVVVTVYFSYGGVRLLIQV